MTEKKICVICGAEFTPTHPCQKLCGNPECTKARHKQYVQNKSEQYKESIRKHRQLPHVKEYRAAYDKQYQLEHKEQIKNYKQQWYQKKRFFEHLAKGEVIDNSYYQSLTKKEKKAILDKLNK